MPWFKKDDQGNAKLVGNNIKDKSTHVILDGDSAEIHVEGKRIIIPARTSVAEARRLIEEAKKK